MVQVEAFDSDNDSDSDSQPIGLKELLVRRAYAYDVCEVGEERRVMDMLSWTVGSVIIH